MRYVIALTALLLLLAAPSPARRAATQKARRAAAQKARATPTPTPETDPPKPSVAISFERQSIRENDAVQVYAWLSNEGDSGLTDVVLHAEMPRRLRWNNVPCADWPPQKFEEGVGNGPLHLGALGAHEVKAHTFCIRSGPEISVGDFNIPFTFEYEWPRDGGVRRSFVTSEKTLKANLFGSDSLAGVPLGLTGLVVPGLFFWVVFSLFRVGWMPWPSGDLALGDRLFYSVLASVLLLFIYNSVASRSLSFPDLNGGVGVSKLLVYVGVGAAAGVAVGGLIRLVQWIRKRHAARRLAQQVQFDDAPEVLLEKLLKLYPDSRLPTAVVNLKNGTQYGGTLAQKGEEATALIGSFQVSLNGLSPEAEEELRRAARPLDIFLVVRRRHLEGNLEPRAVIQQNGQPIPNAAAHLTWHSRQVDRVEVSPDGGSDEPLRLA